MSAASSSQPRDRTSRVVRWTVLALAAVYSAWFGLYTCLEHQRFRTFAYDLGTFDQGIWLAGHGTDYFVTVRGLHLLGDHVRFFSFVLAPLYWVWDDVRALLVLQSIAIAAGAIFVCRIAQRMLPSRPWLALALSAGFLLHPANQNLNLEHAHPDAFAMTFLLAAIDFLGAGRTRAFAVAMALAMSCKEDVPLVFVALGATMMLDREKRKLGFAIAAAAGAYFLLCVAVILPYFNGHGFFRFGAGGFLSTLGEHRSDPVWIFERITRPESLLYLLEVGASNLYLFLLAPLSVVPALPAVAANLLSDAQYMRSLEYHYQTSVVPFLYAGTVAAVVSLDSLRRRWAASESGSGNGARLLGAFLNVLPAALLVSATVANVALSRAPVDKPGALWESWILNQEGWKEANARALLARIPPDAVVAADYSSVPHLSHRRRIYMLPNPFEIGDWGIRGENAHDPLDVEYVAVRSARAGEEVQRLVSRLVQERQIQLVAGDEFTSIYKRIDLVLRTPGGGCGDWDANGEITTEDQRRIGSAIIRGRDCPPEVCDADGNGKLEYRDVLAIGRRARDRSVVLRCPPASP